MNLIELVEIFLKNKIITVDGPAGSGKGRIAKYIARKWKHFHLDSGLLYRRLAYELLKNNISIYNERDIANFIKELKKISSRNHKNLRTERMSKLTSEISVYKKVRHFINKQQRIIVEKKIKNKSCVIDGRDIGSVVFKKANTKLYIEVDIKIRAERRHKQLIDMGEQSIYPKILKEIKLRDKKDKNRKNSPLVIPKGANIIDNSNSFSCTIKQLNKILKKIN